MALVPPRLLRLLLVRHGETEDNARGVFQGQRGRGLNLVGRRQMFRLGARLSSAPVDALFSSDLDRAVESADILGQGRFLIGKDARLREVDVGAWTGLSAIDIQERFPDEWAAWHAGLDVPRGGGETYEALASRVLAALGDIVRGAEEAREIVVVSHGAAIKSVVSSLLGLSGARRRAMGPVENASVTVLRPFAGEVPFQLLTWNDTSHLTGPGTATSPG